MFTWLRILRSLAFDFRLNWYMSGVSRVAISQRVTMGFSIRKYLIFVPLSTSSIVLGAPTKANLSPGPAHSDEASTTLTARCLETLKKLPGTYNAHKVNRLCGQVKTLTSCLSVKGENIYHYDNFARKDSAKRVLVISVIHGDEAESGGVARRWMERLVDINARNSWRIIPLANPDGWRTKTRTNANGVDLNRNFPSEDWNRLAHKYWLKKKNQDPRRNPGKSPASEPETRCLVNHIEEFKPDFIVAVHTPYGILDFDGPKIEVPKFKGLPWVSLGTFPGSLGRYMWKDQQVPVLTVELKDASLLAKLEDVDFLQDIAGTVAIKTSKQMSTRKDSASAVKAN